MPPSITTFSQSFDLPKELQIHVWKLAIRHRYIEHTSWRAGALHQFSLKLNLKKQVPRLTARSGKGIDVDVRWHHLHLAGFGPSTLYAIIKSCRVARMLALEWWRREVVLEEPLNDSQRERKERVQEVMGELIEEVRGWLKNRTHKARFYVATSRFFFGYDCPPSASLSPSTSKAATHRTGARKTTVCRDS